MKPASATPKRPDSACRGDSRRTSRATASTSASPTATIAAVFVSCPEMLYAATKATAGSAVSSMPSGPPTASARLGGEVDGEPSALEVTRRDGAGLERQLDQPRPLGVLREILDAEALEERAQMRLDGLDAEHQVVGDLAVRRRGHVRAGLAVGPAQRDEDPALGIGQHWPGDAAPDHGRVHPLARRPEAHLGAAEAHDVALVE